MALRVARILSVLSIVLYTLKVNEQTDLSEQTLLRQREEEQTQQMQQMMWLQEQMELKRKEQGTEEPRRLHEVVLQALGEHCGWGFAADALLLLLRLLWRRRKRTAAAGSGGQQGSCGPAEQQPGQRGGMALPGRARAPAASSPLLGSASQRREGTAGPCSASSKRFPRAAS